jgi:Na+/serine symporter|tara:strand:- start:270 stop:410 length:141 start_codon:yes stop_codon:yes gene_type:complete
VVLLPEAVLVRPELVKLVRNPFPAVMACLRHPERFAVPVVMHLQQE